MVDVPPRSVADLANMPAVKLQQSADAITVTGSDFAVTIGKASGAIESFKFRDRQLIAAPLIPNFWRAPIDNDKGTFTRARSRMKANAPNVYNKAAMACLYHGGGSEVKRRRRAGPRENGQCRLPSEPGRIIGVGLFGMARSPVGSGPARRSRETQDA